MVFQFPRVDFLHVFDDFLHSACSALLKERPSQRKPKSRTTDLSGSLCAILMKPVCTATPEGGEYRLQTQPRQTSIMAPFLFRTSRHSGATHSMSQAPQKGQFQKRHCEGRKSTNWIEHVRQRKKHQKQIEIFTHLFLEIGMFFCAAGFSCQVEERRNFKEAGMHRVPPCQDAMFCGTRKPNRREGEATYWQRSRSIYCGSKGQ